MKSLVILTLLITSVSCIRITSGEIAEGNLSNGKQYYACINDGPTDSHGELYTFRDNGKYVVEVFYYDDGSCTDAFKREKYFMYGDYSYNSITSDMTMSAYKLEIGYLKAAEVASQNGSSQCGFTDWEIGVVRDITDNMLCMGGTVVSGGPPSVSQAIFNDSIFDDGYNVYTRVNQ